MLGHPPRGFLRVATHEGLGGGIRLSFFRPLWQKRCASVAMDGSNVHYNNTCLVGFLFVFHGFLLLGNVMSDQR